MKVSGIFGATDEGLTWDPPMLPLFPKYVVCCRKTMSFRRIDLFAFLAAQLVADGSFVGSNSVDGSRTSGVPAIPQNIR